jgi:hypothetical protein
MANSIALASKMLPLLDEVYKYASATAILDASNVEWVGANQVKIFKTAMDGLGAYNRNTGFAAGSVTGTWETMTLSNDRGRKFQVDRMDDEETLGMAFGTLAGEFIRTKVSPELDAVRFSKYASTSGILSAAADLTTAAAVLAAIDTAVAAMDDAEVMEEGRIIYLTPQMYALLKASTAVTRFATMKDGMLNRDFEYFDKLIVKKVPQTRFYKGITLYDGTTGGQEAGSYIKTATTGRNINFMIIHPSAIKQVTKHANPRIFRADENQSMDAEQFDYRVYHDAFALENKVKGIYAHIATA